ncbi:unnamed protein product [Phytophthora lilii]|uniref:Unnamed protein product n=1 Tax=Phytophthora lilii TaxID=2077276 RepID=A0A9W6XJ74_9STRA|nr:unnamed protein product [Phytophthora lilii]
MLFLTQPYRSISVPEVKQLKKFSKISLEAGASQTVKITLTTDDWSVYQPQIGEGFKQVAEDTDYVIAIKPETDCDVYNATAAANPLCATFTLQTGDYPYGIEHLADGIAYCQIFDALYPGKVHLQQLNFEARTEMEFERNLKVLRRTFHICDIRKVLALVASTEQASYNQPNFSKPCLCRKFPFENWFRVFFKSTSSSCTGSTITSTEHAQILSARTMVLTVAKRFWGKHSLSHTLTRATPILSLRTRYVLRSLVRKAKC